VNARHFEERVREMAEATMALIMRRHTPARPWTLCNAVNDGGGA